MSVYYDSRRISVMIAYVQNPNPNQQPRANGPLGFGRTL